MKYFQIIKNRIAPVLLSACIGASLCSCTGQKDQQISVAAPVITSDKTLPGESKTTWDCVYFGSYPTSEVVESAFSAVDGYALREGDIINDPGLYAKLKDADWNNNECELDGNKYRRLKAPEDTKAREQHYKWDGESYHYFKYEPIKWRVLEKDDQSAMLVADIDAAIVTTQMMLAIHDLGYGSTWIGHFDADSLKKLFPEMEDYELIALLPVGVMAEDCKPSERHTVSKPKDELVSVL